MYIVYNEGKLQSQDNENFLTKNRPSVKVQKEFSIEECFEFLKMCEELSRDEHNPPPGGRMGLFYLIAADGDLNAAKHLYEEDQAQEYTDRYDALRIEAEGIDDLTEYAIGKDSLWQEYQDTHLCVEFSRTCFISLYIGN